jgi:hypothetical protein
MATHHIAAPVRASVQAVDARPNRTWAAGRTCDHQGCRTALSIYNRSTACSVHEETRSYIHRGARRTKRERERAA